ncbi:HDOD domain-containing protein [Roseiconus lacunae]|uniref:HDOD domain-containing protein n=1 Tax=Roseiconus lacunae TaxID=2605694 RepID=A0ABT7PJ07_9BACT|nr:HDOD domain-containing protein [Roseiconus lacunae]MCD0462943.1 HDOD domain-containing protein [Roseiconus lacunae]MDM4016491.1 HDOD domain-containing protein [Roseiconus lacunae]WRQ49362.1 HDOD domain-containing protein [Stieleria sp. HD01]
MTNEKTIQRIERLIQRPDLLHTPPEVAQSLLQLTQQEDCTTMEIVECIRTDPAMASRVMRLVNSPRFGLTAPVTNLNQAVTLLGQRSMRLIAMTFSITHAFSHGSARVLYNDFWRRALTVASASFQLSKRFSEVDAQDAYTTGLLAHVGTLLLAQAEGEWYLAFYQQHVGLELPIAERDCYGVDHAEIGGMLLRNWNFPDTIVSSVRDHLDDRARSPLAQIVRGGALISGAIWDANSKSVNACRDLLQQRFGIDMEEFTELVLKCRDEVILELEVYGVESKSPPDPTKLLELARQRYMETSLQSALEMDSFDSIFEQNL